MLVTLLGPSLAAQQRALRDTLPGDSIRTDTVDLTKRFLEAQAKGNVSTPVFPLVGVEGPQPPSSRVVIGRDSIEWHNAETLGDLLMRVPGVYLWRGGFVGRPENANFQGRGATALEYYLDGLPYIPIGPDSVGVDPALFALSLLDQVVIERWPGQLRVYLYTRRHDRIAPASRIGLGSGNRKFARYIGALEKRFQSGIGFGMAADFISIPTVSGESSDYSNSAFWLQAGYLPRARFGVQYQLVVNNPRRDPYVSNGLSIGAPLDGQRSDMQLRAFYGRPEDGQGTRIDLLYGRTGWHGTGVDNQVNQGGAVFSYRSATFGATASAFNRSRWTPFDIRAGLSWAPVSRLSLSADAGYQTHDLDRRSEWVGLRAGLRLPGSLTLSGAARTGSIVAAPALVLTPAQKVTDLQGTLDWQSRPAGLELGYARTDAFQPLPYQPYPTIPSLAALGRTDWVTVHARITPVSWITLDSWYSDPRGTGSPDGQPPTHSLTTGTIRSKFWRTFPSGAFDFKAQIGMEAWSDGISGRDSTGVPIALPGRTFFRSLIELQILSFTIYWDRWNLAAQRGGYVPGFDLPTYAYTFGVRWEFRN